MDYGELAAQLPEEVIHYLVAASEEQKAGESKVLSSARLVVIVANGFPGYRGDVKKEIHEAKIRVWLPGTPDFIATAGYTTKGEYYGASNAEEFFGALANHKGKINRVIFIGHGQSEALGLSGDTSGFFSNALGVLGIPKWQNYINAKIKPKLTRNATIDLVACNVAVGEVFMREMAKAFGICVRGFTQPVLWCLKWNEDETAITSRGLVALESKDGRCAGTIYRDVKALAPPKVVCPQ